jgi:hypothetical protein
MISVVGIASSLREAEAQSGEEDRQDAKYAKVSGGRLGAASKDGSPLAILALLARLAVSFPLNWACPDKIPLARATQIGFLRRPS